MTLRGSGNNYVNQLRVSSNRASGNPAVGDILTANLPVGTTASSYMWVIDKGSGYVAISGATGSTYTLTSNEIAPLGTTNWSIEAYAVISNIFSSPFSVGNPYIVPVSLGLPVVTGTPVEGQPLTIYAPGFTGNGLTVVRTIYENNVLVATAAGYTPIVGSAGKQYRVTEVATNPAGSATATGVNSTPCAVQLVTLPTPVLLQSYDSETGKTFAASGTHAIITGQVEGTGRQQMVSPGSNLTLFCTSTETGPFNIASMGTFAWRATKDASYSVSDRLLVLSRGGTNGQQSAGSDGTTKSRTGGQWVAANINQTAFAAVKALADGNLTISPRVSQQTPFTASVTVDAMVYNAKGRGIFCPIWDDAGSGIYDNLFPILTEYGIKGTFAIPINFIGQPGRMTWDQVRALANAGHCIIGNTKADIDIVSGFASDAALVADYTNGVDGWKEQLIAQVPSAWVFGMALSNGVFNDARLAALEGAGLLMARTTNPQYLYNRLGFGANGSEKGQSLTVPSQGTGTAVTTATVLTQLDLADQVGALQCVHGHNVTNSPTSIDQTPAYWRTIFDAFVVKRNAGTMVNMNFKEVYDYTNPLSYSTPGT